jgi:selenocysteine-specific elongation factor
VSVRARLEARLEAAPLDPGLSVGELLPGQPWAMAVLPLLELERRDGKAYLPGTAPALGAARNADAERLEAELAQAGAVGVKSADTELARFLEHEGRLVRLGEGLVVSRAAYDGARSSLVEECERSGSITLARFRDLLGISRRPAQLWLERFDADGVTRRVGDERVLRRGGRS